MFRQKPPNPREGDYDLQPIDKASIHCLAAETTQSSQGDYAVWHLTFFEEFFD